MFWLSPRSKKSSSRGTKLRRKASRRLLLESLERREVLSGVVLVELDGSTLRLTGDQPLVDGGAGNPSDNWVEVKQGAATGQFIVTAKNNTLLREGSSGSLKLSTTVNGVQNIDVQLGLLNDTFELTGATPAGPLAGHKAGAALVRGSVVITNDACGTKKNVLTNVLVKGNLDVRLDPQNTPPTYARSELAVFDSTIEGAVTVNNTDSAGGGGSTSTVLQRVHIEKQLTITNGPDLDVIDIQDSSIDKSTAAGTTISNGPGGSRTTFTSTGATGNTLYGSLTIYNGENPIDVPALQQLDDLVTFNNTNVRGKVFIDNDGGDSRVLVSANTVLGSDISPPSGDPAPSLLLQNGAGVDLFDMQNSTAMFGVSIDHDYGGSSSESNLYGSTTKIYASVIGCCLSGSEGLTVLGDDGNDIVEVTESNITGPVELKLFNGNNSVLLQQNQPIQGLIIETGNQMDVVTIKGSSSSARQVVMLAEIELGDLNDLLVMEHVQFLGDTLLDGEDGDQDERRSRDVLFSGGTVNLLNWENVFEL